MAEQLPALQEKAVSLRDYLNNDKIKGPLADALPKWLSIDRLLRIVFTSAMRQPKIFDCTRESILQSIMLCAQLGIEPILGRGYLIPYNNSVNVAGKWIKQLECQFQPGYQGLVDLARRSGKVDDVFAEVVYEKDEFEVKYGTERILHHKPYIGEVDPGKVIGAYAVWYLSSGIKPFEFMPLYKIYKRRDRSQAYMYAKNNPNNKKAQDIPWIAWEDEMCRKTVIKHSSKLMPASIEFMDALELDNLAEIGRSQVGYHRDDFAMKLPAPPEKEKPITFKSWKEFLESQPGIDSKELEAFAQISADAAGDTGMPVEELKARAIKNPESFLESFHLRQTKKKKRSMSEWTKTDWESWINTWKAKSSKFVEISMTEEFIAILKGAPDWVQAVHKKKWTTDAMIKHVQGARWPLDPPEEPEEEIKEIVDPGLQPPESTPGQNVAVDKGPKKSIVELQTERDEIADRITDNWAAIEIRNAMDSLGIEYRLVDGLVSNLKELSIDKIKDLFEALRDSDMTF